ncbi:MAG: phosphoribosyl-dephospho-CoA transferase, partial [Burkholderiales bacterium]|nr:phosphoribosyl-dephospho-CoA transferase [Burkholderiales bacterium]
IAHLGLELRVYGSWSWQALTCLPYVRASSDIDLLFTPKNSAQLQAGLALLQRHARLLPLDGEVIFPQQQAVAWREWLNASVDAHVLVKSCTSVSLQTRAVLLASFATREQDANSCAVTANAQC